MIREPAKAGQFYPATAAECRSHLAECRRKEPGLPAGLAGTRILGGLLPHASWYFSGPTALAVFDSLAKADPQPETVIIFATSHRSDVSRPSLQSEGIWRVPTGDVEIDTELARAMLEETEREVLVDRAMAHVGDHAIEVQLPLLLDTLPDARFVPVAMPHCDWGPAIGRAAARAIQKTGRKAAALASTDLTHYGPNWYGFAPKGVGLDAHRWCKECNDGLFLEKVLSLDDEQVYEVGRRDYSACGPSATAAAIACGKILGANKATLIEHITSWEREKCGDPSDWVGYAAVVWG